MLHDTYSIVDKTKLLTMAVTFLILEKTYLRQLSKVNIAC